MEPSGRTDPRAGARRQANLCLPMCPRAQPDLMRTSSTSPTGSGRLADTAGVAPARRCALVGESFMTHAVPAPGSQQEDEDDIGWPRKTASTGPGAAVTGLSTGLSRDGVPPSRRRGWRGARGCAAAAYGAPHARARPARRPENLRNDYRRRGEPRAFHGLEVCACATGSVRGDVVGGRRTCGPGHPGRRDARGGPRAHRAPASPGPPSRSGSHAANRSKVEVRRGPASTSSRGSTASTAWCRRCSCGEGSTPSSSMKRKRSLR
jgi:hypothetical protein